MSVGYVAYIDESGDDGLARVRPRDSGGASEWFILSAVVLPANSGREALWVQSILSELKLEQRRTLHFQPLDAQRQIRTCQQIAKLPVRCFTFVSNKQNMEGHSNPRAARVSYSAGRTWFYWWSTRILLERITDYCERRSFHEYKEPRLVRIEFARRGGLLYAHCQGYLFWLKMQSRADALWIKRGDLKWSVIDPIGELRVYDPGARPGLQLADAVSGAFYQAVHGKPEAAIALEPRMAFDARKRIFDYGVKMMPNGYLKRLRPEQRAIFDHYIRK